MGPTLFLKFIMELGISDLVHILTMASAGHRMINYQNRTWSGSHDGWQTHWAPLYGGVVALFFISGFNNCLHK